MKEHTTVRIDPGLMSAVRNEQMRERRGSQTETISTILEDGLAYRGIFNFNVGANKIGMNRRRDEFHAWCKANDVPAYNTLQAWENYATQFETDDDAADLRNTQQDAL